MMRTLIFLQLFTALSSSKFIVNQIYSTWLQEHAKQFQNLSEMIQTNQQKSLLENFQIIEKHNKENSDFELGYNDYSYMDKEDFVNSYCKTLLPKKFLPDRLMTSKAKAFNNFTINNLPESFSWKEFIRPVKRQGECGSCYAFATMAMLEGVNKKKNRNWNHDLSPQYIVDCDRESDGCNGGWPTDVLKFLKKQSKNEAPTTANYPYKGIKQKCRMVGFPKVKLNINEIFEFKFKGNEKQIRLNLVNYGPLIIAMYVNKKSGLFQNYKKGIFYEPGCPKNCKEVNHAMLMVGYGVTNDAAKKPYYLILNSWGESWGEKGWARMAADRGNNCNTACFGIVSN